MLALKPRFWTTGALVALVGTTWSQVEWSLDTSRIQWGERLTLTADWLLTAEELGSGVADSSAWPAWTDTTAGGLEVLASSPLDTLPAPAGAQSDVLLRKKWVLTSWDSGFVVIPPAQFGPYETTPLLIEVLTPLLAEDAQPANPASIVDVTWTWWERLMRTRFWWGSALALLALFAAMRWAWKAWKARDVDAPAVEAFEEPVEAPHRVALRILRRLLEEEGWKSGQAKEVQAKASLAVRHYLEGQFVLPAAERTTREIESMLPASGVPREWQGRLIQALELADAVKFAKGQLPDLSHRSLLEAYIAFVLDTQPKEHDDA